MHDENMCSVGGEGQCVNQYIEILERYTPYGISVSQMTMDMFRLS